MVIKYGPHGKFPGMSGIPGMSEYKAVSGKDWCKMSDVRKRCSNSQNEEGKTLLRCENNPECEFMSWQKPSEKKCPQCGNYMVEKGNKLLCSNEQCGYTESIKKEKKIKEIY